MHPIQQAILDLAGRKNLADMTLKAIGREATGKEHSAQKIQYHMDQLRDAGLLKLDKTRNLMVRVSRGGAGAGIVALPILGRASAGPATALAEGNVEGYLQISRTITGNSPQTHFIVRAVGNSMNKAKVGKEKLNINDGDFIVVDGKVKSPDDGDYVLSVIDGYANVKRFHRDSKTGQVALFSESSEEHQPIFIHPEDPIQYIVAGRVKYVIKKPTIKWS